MIPCHGFRREIITFVELGLWGGARHFGEATAMGWADETGIVAGFVWHDFNPDQGSIEVSGYSNRRDWCSKSILQELFGYPFDQLGLRIVCARHSVRNRRVRRIWASLGAQEAILPRLRGDDEDEAVAILHRDDWRKGFLAKIQGYEVN